MTTKESANRLEDLLPGLAQAVAAGEGALQGYLEELGLAPAHRARFGSQASALWQRSLGRRPPTSTAEIELALGVLWTLHAGMRLGKVEP